MPKHAVDKIKQITGFQYKTGSISYLGIPLFKGKTKVPHFKYLLDKINAKLVGWQSKFLSQAGRITLIKSVLSSFPIYSASVVVILYTIHKQIEKICANFLWQGVESPHRKHWYLGIRYVDHILMVVWASAD